MTFNVAKAFQAYRTIGELNRILGRQKFIPQTSIEDARTKLEEENKLLLEKIQKNNDALEFLKIAKGKGD